MHPNPAFRGMAADRSRAFAKDRGFGILTANGPEGPVAAHVPFLLAGDVVATHLARSNPLARLAREGVAALLAVPGPEGYISPDWYGLADQVPTWNYVAVHLRGTLRLLPQEVLRPHLEALSAEFERRLDKRPWTHHKMTPEALERLERMIVPVELAVASVDSTWKLNQNKPEAARLAAADALEREGTGAERAVLARLMREG